MIFAVDIGNTNIVLGCIENRKILFTERLSTDHSKTDLEHAISIKTVLELHQIDPGAIEGAIIGSVVPPLTGLFREALRKITGCTALVVGPGIKTGLNILIDNPAQIGSDLVAAAVAGIAEYPVPQILIDMGTATTISVIDRNKNFTGGMILPGLRVSLQSLTSNTSQLPSISLDPPRRLIGKNTVESMKSGVLYGNASCIDGMIDRIEAELGQKTTVIATGGLSRRIVPLCSHEILLDDALLLKGLLLLYEKNIP